MREFLNRNIDTKIVPGDWTIWHRYTYGVAGERFFREMKENGRFVASVCPRCRKAFLPPCLYCEDCFGATTGYRVVESSGVVETFTVLWESLEEEPLSEPLIVAFIRFEGIKGGWLAPLLNVTPDKVRIGMRVKPLWKPKGERGGTIDDLLGFEPIGL